MSRPRKCRRVCCLPKCSTFTPAHPEGRRPARDIILTVDEYEAIRLIDKEGFSQEECSTYMQVARTTVQQIYTAARRKIACALVDGCALRIEGGDYQLCDGEEAYCQCGGCLKHRCQRDTAETEKETT